MLTLGIDSSTQSVKALVYNVEDKSVVTTVSVNFGKDLPAFGCPDGFLPNADPLVRQADPRLWVAALDKVLQKLADAFDTSKIDAIGGDGQQHGSVYLGEGWTAALAALADAPRSGWTPRRTPRSPRSMRDSARRCACAPARPQSSGLPAPRS